jgi:hypothetical protein
MSPIGDGNKHLDKFITQDLNINLKVEDIHTTNNYPCVLDDD